MGYIALIILLVGLDQITKYEIIKNFVEGATRPLIDNFLHITYVRNRGMAFGLFQGKIDIISILTVIAIIGIAIYMVKNFKKLVLIEKFGYSFILAGAIGNIIDRLSYGFVVDMIDFRGIWSYVFNFADVWINIGALLIIVDQIIQSKKKIKEEK
jgi:signal peptidase II